MWQWPKRALLISLNNDNNNRFALCLDEERLNWVCEGVRALESGGVAEGGSHYWNGWVKWAFYWGLSLANLPHVTAQPDLLPWNATGCCAEDKKRQRLKLQGCNTSWSWRAAQLCQERKKKRSQGFLTHPFLSRPQPPPNIHFRQSWAAAALTHHQSWCIRTVFTHHLRCFGRLLAPIWPTALFLSPSLCLQCLQLFLSCYAVTLGPHLVYSLRDFPWIPEPWQGQTVQILRVDGSSTQQWMFFYLLPL